MKQRQLHYLNFTRKERNGIIFILSVIILCVLTPVVFPLFFKGRTVIASRYEKEKALLDSLQADSNTTPAYKKRTYNTGSYKVSNMYPGDKKNVQLFYFDPNTITGSEWQQLGVSGKTVSGIQHYLSKGGRFKHAADIKKIWGISPQLQEKLLPYVRIGAVASDRQRNVITGKPFHQPFEKRAVQPVDVNSGDSTAFEALPGIGPKLAGRIIAFRNKLGGFYNVDQVAETFGLPDSTFQNIKFYLHTGDVAIRKINLNTATPESLKAHPYIRWQLGNVIIEYRKQRGHLSSVSELKKIMILTDDVYNKIAPYLSAE